MAVEELSLLADASTPSTVTELPPLASPLNWIMPSRVKRKPVESASRLVKSRAPWGSSVNCKLAMRYVLVVLAFSIRGPSPVTVTVSVGAPNSSLAT
ncbi:MAG: hypothetical protein ACPL88_11750 [Bryobacteraceae bacterium]